VRLSSTPNESEAMCVSDERNTGERQFAISHPTKIHIQPTQNIKDKTFQLPRSCSVSQLEQITSTQDPSTTQKLRSRFFVAATEIWAATRSSTSNQPYTLSF